MGDGTVRKFILRRLSASQEIVIGDRHTSNTLSAFRKEHPKSRVVNVDGDSNPTAAQMATILEGLSAKQLAEMGLQRKRGPKKDPEPEPEPEEVTTEE
jgi:hypothetical protein